MLLGVHLTLRIGSTTAVPAPLLLTEALSGVEVTQNEAGRSGFQLTFQVGRSGPFDLLDYNLLTNPLLRPFNRVVVQVLFNLTPTVLLDGVITHVQLTPSEEPGASLLSVSGEDVSLLMALEETTESFPNQTELMRVKAISAKYPELGLVADLRNAPSDLDQSVATVSIPKKNGSDYAYLEDLASQHSCVFYVRPGFAANSNLLYFGQAGQPDLVAKMFPPPALSVNMGPQTNVDSINFSYDGQAFEQVNTTRSEPQANMGVPVMSAPLSTDPPLALVPAVMYELGKYRKVRADQPLGRGSGVTSDARNMRVPDGMSPALALARAQARTNASAQRVVTVSGELDGLRYGAVLPARSTVYVRGVGATFDGSYYVQSVTHSIRKGEYKQRFSLQRSGVYPLSPVVCL